ncbi:hypothetical protein AUEXF2481DRAFT_604312 [Aureobasidium subglaciale EXF-2481]|uniref:Hydrophobin n=1 Tax=Aureobasidium subglaciale (strain EXF-2481) TaxID=1043005 RepID=A0A074ZG20_AURSE|nr:uncharacterized protein AUEXF2481DRAFT_604312 [Aureobasidium subglaciale EXF-2481]KEQ97561.1 hypothetical protein AUEXF2481DRAFT_604312 [Aureobasidium subglaciale EXF-2481]
MLLAAFCLGILVNSRSLPIGSAARERELAGLGCQRRSSGAQLEINPPRKRLSATSVLGALSDDLLLVNSCALQSLDYLSTSAVHCQQAIVNSQAMSNEAPCLPVK